MDYYLAQTYLDRTAPSAPRRSRKAAKAFDDIFQRDRTATAGLTDAGLLAHMWHGKTAEELGDLDLATDIYDEVLANPRNSGEKGPATGWEPWFAQVEYFRLLVLAKQKPREFLAEAAAWLQQYRRLKQTDGYQGIALELAKALYAQAEKAHGPEKAKRASDALQILIEMSKVRSQYQQEAILLKREILKAAGKSDLEVGHLRRGRGAGRRRPGRLAVAAGPRRLPPSPGNRRADEAQGRRPDRGGARGRGRRRC